MGIIQTSPVETWEPSQGKEEGQIRRWWESTEESAKKPWWPGAVPEDGARGHQAETSREAFRRNCLLAPCPLQDCICTCDHYGIMDVCCFKPQAFGHLSWPQECRGGVRFQPGTPDSASEMCLLLLPPLRSERRKHMRLIQFWGWAEVTQEAACTPLTLESWEDPEVHLAFVLMLHLPS